MISLPLVCGRTLPCFSVVSTCVWSFICFHAGNLQWSHWEAPSSLNGTLGVVACVKRWGGVFIPKLEFELSMYGAEDLEAAKHSDPFSSSPAVTATASWLKLDNGGSRRAKPSTPSIPRPISALDSHIHAHLAFFFAADPFASKVFSTSLAPLLCLKVHLRY